MSVLQRPQSAADAYFRHVLATRVVPSGPGSPAYAVAQGLYPSLAQWAGVWLDEISFSGSHAKGTGVAGTTDVDLFISLRSQTPGSLRTIYYQLVRYIRGLGLVPRIQNVSVGLTYHGVSIDLVPGRLHPRSHNYHSLWRSKASTWTQTSVAEHTSTVVGSGRVEEIRAVKIWRMLRGLAFPSFYLELAVIQALSGCRYGDLVPNLVAVMEFLGKEFPRAVIYDPANTNNRLSDELTLRERLTIARGARESLARPWWEFIW